ncbi:MAG TPA: M18 family aminopeptidase, partial [Lachnospiraceae bacterium]|nr:M18 family aminopeptidase [Lachnospiraceae bacterium]
SNFRIVATHTDHPCLKVKPSADLTSNGFRKINTEVYGGPILNTWLDRPLSIAGRVALSSSSIFEPEIQYIDLQEPVLTIPNLAIHMNRDVNKGVELNRQVDMIPIAALVDEELNKENYFLDYLAKKLDVNPNDILDFDLYIYNAEKGQIIGMQEDFISAPRIDNLTSTYAALRAITSGNRQNGINVIALFDNEEVGSKTKQGADSTLMTILLQKIFEGLNFASIRCMESIMRSMHLSVDVAHAIHPAHSEKSDPTTFAKLNEGIVIKINHNQKYATDTQAIATLQQVCASGNVKYQKYVNRSDMVGGSTLGSIVSSQLPMMTVDIGVPMLAMHSARELMGVKDQTYMTNLLSTFFTA